MASIKLRGHEYTCGRYGLALTCEDHPEFYWVFDGPSWEPGEWETAMMIAYGHHAWAHVTSVTDA